jgi:hypothetical protein
MSLLDILSDLGSHQYLALAALAALYVRKLVSSDSKFPLTLPAAWQPVASAFVGAVYGGIVAKQGGASTDTAVLDVVMAAGGGGIFDMVLVAVFANPATAPGWAKAIVFLVDDLTGDTSGGSGTGPTGGAAALASVSAIKPAAPPPAPVAPTVACAKLRSIPPMAWAAGALAGVLGMASVAGSGAALSACKDAQAPAQIVDVSVKILSDLEAGDQAPQIENDVAAMVGNDIADGGSVDALIVVTDVRDGIQFLLDIHAVPAQFVPIAEAILGQESTKIESLKAKVTQ